MYSTYAEATAHIDPTVLKQIQTDFAEDRLINLELRDLIEWFGSSKIGYGYLNCSIEQKKLLISLLTTLKKTAEAVSSIN